MIFMTGVAVALAALFQGRGFFALRWRPTASTAAAIGVGLLTIAFSALALEVGRRSLAYDIILWILIFGLCGFTLPPAYVFLVEGRSYGALGIHRKRRGLSILLSLLFAAPIFYATLHQADLSKYPASRLLAAVVSLNVGGLFELFLYYGFLHLRLLYSLWHIGTELPLHARPGEALLLLFVVGLLYQSVFAITYNVFIVWPLFFTAGVMHDFIVNLDLPEAVAGGSVWPVIGLAIAVAVPAALHRHSQQSARGVEDPLRSGPRSGSQI